MTTRRVDWLTALTWGALVLVCMAILTVLFLAAGWFIVHAVEWLATVAVPGIVTWADDNPNAFDVLLIGVLALLALAGAEVRR